MSARHAFNLLALGFALFGVQASGAGHTSIAITPAGSSAQIPATLIKPDGEGPFAAVVMMHDCSGLGPRSSGAPLRWAEELVEQGYVVALDWYRSRLLRIERPCCPA